MSLTGVEPSEDVIFQALHKELVLLNLKTQQYFALDDVGSDMWKMLVEHHDIETVANLLSAEYDVDPGTLRSDLDHLVERLLAAGLLRTAHASATQTV